MKAAVIGTVASTQACLQALLQSPLEVVCLVTRRASPSNADFVDLVPLAELHHIPCLFWSKETSADMRFFLEHHAPDVIFCVGWSHLLPPEIFHIPRYGAIGFHPAPLPKGRGRHPLIWALALGLESTDSCFFRIEEGADSGDVLSRRTLPILPEDDATSLMEKLLRLVGEQTGEIAVNLLNGPLRGEPQDDGQAVTWRKRSKIDGWLDFRMTATSLHNLIRALARPYPGAHFTWNGEEHTVWKSRPGPVVDWWHEPGKVLKVADGILHVVCGDHTSLFLLEHTCRPAPTAGEYLSVLP